MTVLIIDDEISARSLLRNILNENCDVVTEILEAENLKDGVKVIRERRPKLVFLDIEMPQEQGTEIFNYFHKIEIDFEIVFATAYDRYALKAFEMNAVDYILKPLRPKRVIEITQLVIKLYPNPAQTQLNIELKEAANLKIVNLLGETVVTQKATIGSNTINVSHLTSGVYFLHVSNRGAVKFMKE